MTFFQAPLAGDFFFYKEKDRVDDRAVIVHPVTRSAGQTPGNRPVTIFIHKGHCTIKLVALWSCHQFC
jgi:hypothetical protein